MNDQEPMPSGHADEGMPSSPAFPSPALPKVAPAHRRARGATAISVALLVAVSGAVAAARGAMALSLSSIVLIALPAIVIWVFGIHALLFGAKRGAPELATSVVVSIFSASIVAFALGAAATTLLQPMPSDVVEVTACKDAAAAERVVYGLDPRAPTIVLVKGDGQAMSIVAQGVRNALQDKGALLHSAPHVDSEQDPVAKLTSDALRASSGDVFTNVPTGATAEATVLALHGRRLISATVGGMRVGLWRNGQWSDLTSEAIGERIGATDDVSVELVSVDLVDGDVVVAIADGSALPATGDGVDAAGLAAGHGGAAVLRFHPTGTEPGGQLPLTCSSSSVHW